LCTENASIEVRVDGLGQFVHRRELQWSGTADAGVAHESVETMFATVLADLCCRGEYPVAVCDVS
jgi:hypothetical protein